MTEEQTLTFDPSQDQVEEAPLLKANDAATVAFGRSLRGYNADEVDDFLDDVADSLHRYAEMLAEAKEEIAALKGRLCEYEAVRESLEDTVRVTKEETARAVEQVNAQAGDFLEQAKAHAEMIVSEARQNAEAQMTAARENALRLMNQTEDLRNRRSVLLAQCRKLADDFNDALSAIEQEHQPRS